VLFRAVRDRSPAELSVRFCPRIHPRRSVAMKDLFVSVLVLLALISVAVALSAHQSWPVNRSLRVTV